MMYPEDRHSDATTKAYRTVRGSASQIRPHDPRPTACSVLLNKPSGAYNTRHTNAVTTSEKITGRKINER